MEVRLSIPRPLPLLSLIAFCALFAAAAPLPGRAAGLEARIDTLVARSYPAHGPGAAVLVVRRGSVLLRKGYGQADLRAGTRVDPGDCFEIGSITKQFTAVAILQLAAAGRLRLDDDITRYVPECPTHGRRVTLAELLSHTSGLPNFTALPGFRDDPWRDWSVSEVLGLIRDRPLNFEPGTAWSYCNTGYMLLGAVVEKISGQDFGAYLREHEFGPAGLRTTTLGSAPAGERPIAGYTRALGGGWTGARRLSAATAFAAGGVVSDVDDLYRWETALAAGRLLRPDLLTLARSPAPVDGGAAQARYGYGWELGSLDGRSWAGHGGTVSGFRSYEISVPELGLYVAILCNADRPKADPRDVADAIVRTVDEGELMLASVDRSGR